MQKHRDKLIAAVIFLVVLISIALLRPSPPILAATNINSTTTEHWAWSDVLGWIDFYNTNSVNVTSQKITGYASSSAGDISLDCATTRSGNVCGTSDYYVVNDGNGNLSGWGWNDIYGWVSFYCGNNDGCGTSSYRTILSASGTQSVFSNYAWNDILGWISFNCSDISGCGTSNYKVATSWTATSTSGTLESSTFDTGVSGGAQINSILWQGTLPSPQASSWVGFQIAVSNSSSGPWSFIGGASGTSNGWYTAGPNTPMALNLTLHNNNRYFRYRIKLTSNLSQTASPRVDDVSVNWSR